MATKVLHCDGLAILDEVKDSCDRLLGCGSVARGHKVTQLADSTQTSLRERREMAHERGLAHPGSSDHERPLDSEYLLKGSDRLAAAPPVVEARDPLLKCLVIVGGFGADHDRLHRGRPGPRRPLITTVSGNRAWRESNRDALYGSVARVCLVLDHIDEAEPGEDGHVVLPRTHFLGGEQ